MLNINNLNFFRTQYQKTIFPKQTIQQNPFKFSGANLAPLAFDTVSFSGNKSLNKSLFEAFDNKEVCFEVHENAKLAEKDLKNVLERSLKSLVYSKENPNLPIEAISTRVKSPYSIREKVASELENSITQVVPKAFNPNKASDIKKTLGDIVGARITLRSNDSSETSKIIDALIEEVNAGRLKIKKIENYQPVDLQDKYRYFKMEDLKRLQEAANNMRKPEQPFVKCDDKPKKTGYTALHIDVDLSNDSKYVTDNNGYGGEIQIIGSDVLRLKEVEDACYKLQQGKTIRAEHPAYSAFTSYFLKNYNNTEKYPNIQKDFTEYTALAFAKQRQKEPVDTIAKKRRNVVPFHKEGLMFNNCKEFLTIEEAGMTGRIPPELDFNRLADIKYFSDGLFMLAQNNK